MILAKAPKGKTQGAFLMPGGHIAMNHEGYKDPTADIAISRVMKEQARKRRKKNKKQPYPKKRAVGF